MSQYDGKRVRLHGSRDYWNVDGGQRRRCTNVYDGGMREIVALTEEEMDDIPIAGAEQPVAAREPETESDSEDA